MRRITRSRLLKSLLKLRNLQTFSSEEFESTSRLSHYESITVLNSLIDTGFIKRTQSDLPLFIATKQYKFTLDGFLFVWEFQDVKNTSMSDRKCVVFAKGIEMPGCKHFFTPKRVNQKTCASPACIKYSENHKWTAKIYVTNRNTIPTNFSVFDSNLVLRRLASEIQSRFY